MLTENTSITAYANLIKRNQSIFIQIWSITVFILGGIGHMLNIYVFTRRLLRSNSCARYFLASTIAGCFVVYINIPLRLLQNVYLIDLFIYSNFACKTLSYLLVCGRMLPSWFVALACVDRYLCSSSSVTYRNWSSIRITNYFIPLVFLFIILIDLHIPFYTEILLTQQICYMPPGIYQTFFSFWNLIFWSWIPTGCMLSFGFLTIRNIHQGKRRVATQENQIKKQRQLIRMTLVQAFIFGSTTMIYSFISLYFSARANLILNTVEKAKDMFILNIFTYIALSTPCLSFYLFTLSSQLFRRELRSLWHYRRDLQIPTITNIRLQTIKGLIVHQ